MEEYIARYNNCIHTFFLNLDEYGSVVRAVEHVFTVRFPVPCRSLSLFAINRILGWGASLSTGFKICLISHD